MPSIDAVKDILSESDYWGSLNPFERRELETGLEGGSVFVPDLVLVNGVYDLLSLDFEESEAKGLVSALTANIRGIFEGAGKYGFDLSVAFIYRYGGEISKGDLDFLAQNAKSLSFVTKELLFRLDEAELEHIGDEDAFASHFGIDEIASEVAEAEKTQKNK